LAPADERSVQVEALSATLMMAPVQRGKAALPLVI